MGASASDLPGFGGSLALSLLTLGVVCLAAYVGLRLLAHRGNGRPDVGIRIIGRCFVEPRRSLYLIEVGARCFLVGVGDGPMSLLAEIDRATLPAGGLQARPTRPLADVLAKLLGKGKR